MTNNAVFRAILMFLKRILERTFFLLSSSKALFSKQPFSVSRFLLSLILLRSSLSGFHVSHCFPSLALLRQHFRFVSLALSLLPVSFTHWRFFPSTNFLISPFSNPTCFLFWLFFWLFCSSYLSCFLFMLCVSLFFVYHQHQKFGNTKKFLRGINFVEITKIFSSPRDSLRSAWELQKNWWPQRIPVKITKKKGRGINL